MHQGRRDAARPLLSTACLVTIASLGIAARSGWTQGRTAHAPELRYHNPVLFADYSDPDVIRDGKDFYLVASSFEFSPGLPLLHSLDLVHWELAGHILPKLNFGPAYNMEGDMRYGRGVWAPAIRFHNGLFYVYFPTPDEGIFVTTAPKMTGPWSAPVAVIAGPGWEDPCPFWDDDGRAYLVHSKLHAGPLILHRMSPDGKRVLDEGKIIVQDPKELPTLEGPKFYKRNGWYYIFAPMGGVGQGAQAVLRSRNIYGPYEHRIVLAQGLTAINGPHQGGYVETPDGKGWFLHFQLRGAHGRIVHLEPVRWEDDWPVMGEVLPGHITGQPVADGPMPVIAPGAQRMHPATSDEFTGTSLGQQWEWNHNPDDTRWSLNARKGYLRLYPNHAEDLLHARNTLTQSMQDESLEFTTRVDVRHLADGDRTGLSFFDKNLSYVAAQQAQGARSVLFSVNGKDSPAIPITSPWVQFRGHLDVDTVTYSYSLDDGHSFHIIGEPVKLVFSWWKGARPALFAFNTSPSAPSKSFVDFDWAHYRALPTPPDESRP